MTSQKESERTELLACILRGIRQTANYYDALCSKTSGPEQILCSDMRAAFWTLAERIHAEFVNTFPEDATVRNSDLFLNQARSRCDESQLKEDLIHRWVEWARANSDTDLLLAFLKLTERIGKEDAR